MSRCILWQLRYNARDQDNNIKILIITTILAVNQETSQAPKNTPDLLTGDITYTGQSLSNQCCCTIHSTSIGSTAIVHSNQH